MKTSLALPKLALLAVAALGACNTHTAIGELRDAAPGTGGSVGPDAAVGDMAGGGSGGTGLPAGSGGTSATGGTFASGGSASGGSGTPPMGGAPGFAGSSASSSLAFMPSVTYPVQGVSALTVADMNGDGAADTVALTYNSVATGGQGPGTGGASASGGASGSISSDGYSLALLLSDGKGKLLAPKRISASSGLSSLAAGDIDGDGKPDIAASDNTSGVVNVFVGDGRGGLNDPTSFSIGFSPAGIAIADLNGDARLDIGTADIGSSEIPGNIGILLNGGNGAFIANNYPSGNQPAAIAFADFNGDGSPDAAVINSGGISVLLNDGGGHFGGAGNLKTYAAGSGSRALAIGDLNGDGKPDIALAGGTSFGGGVGVLFNLGQGNFGAAVIYDAAHLPLSIAVGDMNGDGFNDLIACYDESGTVGVYLNRGTGTFAAPVGFETDAWVKAVALGDVNGDGKLDVVAANWNGIAVLINAR